MGKAVRRRCEITISRLQREAQVSTAIVLAVSRRSHQFVQFLSAGSAGTFRSSRGLRWNMRGCRRGLTFSLLLVAMSAFGQQDQTPAPSAASPTSVSADKAVRAPASQTDGP